jgi:hypothetical protein
VQTTKMYCTYTLVWGRSGTRVGHTPETQDRATPPLRRPGPRHVVLTSLSICRPRRTGSPSKAPMDILANQMLKVDNITRTPHYERFTISGTGCNVSMYPCAALAARAAHARRRIPPSFVGRGTPAPARSRRPPDVECEGFVQHSFQ